MVELHKPHTNIRFDKNTHAQSCTKNLQLRKVYIKRLIPVTDDIIAKPLGVTTTEDHVLATWDHGIMRHHGICEFLKRLVLTLGRYTAQNSEGIKVRVA